MQEMNLKIDDNFLPHFKAMIDSFVKDHKVKIVNENNISTLMINSVEEVKRRVKNAENRINTYTRYF